MSKRNDDNIDRISEARKRTLASVRGRRASSKSGDKDPDVELHALTICYEVAKGQLLEAFSDFELRKPSIGLPPGEGGVELSITENATKDDVLDALRRIQEKIEVEGLPPTVIKCKRQWAEAVLKGQRALARLNATIELLPSQRLREVAMKVVRANLRVPSTPPDAG